MSLSSNNLRNFIARFKDTDLMDEAFLTFSFGWLVGFPTRLTRQVWIEMDRIQTERILENWNDRQILGDLIKALENMLNNSVH